VAQESERVAVLTQMHVLLGVSIIFVYTVESKYVIQSMEEFVSICILCNLVALCAMMFLPESPLLLDDEDDKENTVAQLNKMLQSHPSNNSKNSKNSKNSISNKSKTLKIVHRSKSLNSE